MDNSELRYLGVGVFLRISLYFLLENWDLSNRMELSTPITKASRVSECLHLLVNNINPYEGDTCHETPLALAFLLPFKLISSRISFPFLHLIADILAAMLVKNIASLQQERSLLFQERTICKIDSKLASQIKASPSYLTIDKNLPAKSLAFYFINPMTIGLFLAKSSFPILLLPCFGMLLAALKGKSFAAALLLAFSTYQSPYCIMLLPAVAFILERKTLMSFSIFTIQTITWIAIMILASFAIIGSWNFFPATFGFVLFVPEYTPNLGFWWYFFTQMFQHFYNFFIGIHVMLVVSLWIPITLKLRNHPLAMACVLLGVIALFKTYPCFGDTLLYVSLISVFPHLHKYFRYHFIVGSVFVAYIVLGTVFWYGWLYSGSGNANFVYAITLVWQAAQILLVVDIFHAVLRHEYSITLGDKTNQGQYKELISKIQ